MGYEINISYPAWRARALEERLRDGDGPVPERALQVIWQQQRLRSRLRLSDGRAVRVLHPGFWNHAAGPDFRRAIVAVEGEAPRCGDIEVDVEAAGWHAHGHDRNPAFANVMLRVVWSPPARAGAPILSLRDQLDAPWPELREWAMHEPAGDLPERMRGACCEPLRDLDDERLGRLLNEAGLVRLAAKSAAVELLAREHGWEAALLVSLFIGLGYKRNAWPMRRIAEAMLRLDYHAPDSRAHEELLLATMLGIGGLMPEAWTEEDRQRSDYLSRLWSLWWRLRESVSEHRLPKAVWQLGGVRPVNRPERRLALAARWLASGDLVRRFEAWSNEDTSPPKAAAQLLQILRAGGDSSSFWESRCTFAAEPLARPTPLLGGSRLTELAMNAVLPWLHARARTGRNAGLIAGVERRYLGWPKAEDNAVLKLARQRLLGARPARCLRGAGQQQGLLQIVRDFCARSDSLCTECPFPAYVNGLTDPDEARRE